MNEVKLTEKYENNWEKYIGDEINKIQNNFEFPFFYYDLNQNKQEFKLETLIENLETIKNEKFTISVCGAVKAGKSTFLNSILFGYEVLPSFSTPMTAKITFIEYTDQKPYFEVSFYSKDEFDGIYKNLSLEEKNLFDERLEECNNKGGNNCCGNLDVIITDLDKLEEYVTDPKSGNGKYTPYVKSVTIKINDPKIKDLRIVDTPGINDPNIINSQETLKWITKTHAVIYLIRPKGIEQSDMRFVEEFVMNTPKESRLWIINKIDDYNDFSDLKKVKDYIYGLNNKEDFRSKNLFSNDESICGYSAKISLLNNKKPEELTEDEEEQLDILGSEFNPDPDNVPKIINDCLYKNTGEQRIIRGIGEIFRMYSLRLTHLNDEYCSKQLQVADLKKDKLELKKQIESLTKIQNKIRNQINNIQDEVRNSVLSIYQENLVVHINNELDKFIKTAESKIEDITQKYQFQSRINYIDKEITRILHMEELPRCLNACMYEISKKIKKGVDSLNQIFELENLEIEISTKYLISLPEIGEIINVLEASDIAKKYIGFAWTKKGKMELLIEILGDIVNVCKSKVKETVFNEFKSSILTHINNTFEHYLKQLVENIQIKQENLELDPTKVEKKLEKLNVELEEIEDRFININDMYEKYKFSIPRSMMLNNKKIILGEE